MIEAENFDKITDMNELEVYDFQFTATLEELESNTLNLQVDETISAGNGQTLKINNLRLNKYTSIISGEMKALGDYEDYYLLGEDDKGNKVAYQMISYDDPKIIFELDRNDENYPGPDTDAEVLTLQLYAVDNTGEVLSQVETGDDDTYGELSGRSYEEGEDPKDFYIPLGEKFEIQLKK